MVISTFNRVQSLRTTLDALRYQRHRDFEVVVVNGPSDDGTGELLSQRGDELRVVHCTERRLAVSRNLGIDAAAGEVVAFIDDDAVPEPGWLADLADAYVGDSVGGAGGLVLDDSGVLAQYRFSLCDRIGRPDFDSRPPFDAFVASGADPFVYLQGTNCSFRRSALEAVGGFDEHIAYNYDDVEICARVLDLGLELRPLEGAVVHHHLLPSPLRRDPYAAIKDRTYFALREGAAHRPRGEALGSLAAHLAAYVAHMDSEIGRGHCDEAEREWAVARAQEGFADGLELGLTARRARRTIAAADPAAFLAYPRRAPEEPHQTVCFLGPDPGALELAGRGVEVHVLEAADDRYRISFDNGVWRHRYPATAALRGAYDRAAARFSFDRVVGELPPDDADPARFPYDVEAEVLRALLHPDPGTVVAGVYAALLRRPPTEEERIAAAPRAAADENAFVRYVATSDEARRLEHDQGFLERLPRISFADLRREVTTLCFEDDDDVFVTGVRGLLPGATAAFTGDRAAFVADAVSDPRAGAGAAGEDLAWLGVPRTKSEILAELQAAPDEEAVIAIAYQRLLARPADPGSAGLYGLGPEAIVWIVGTSQEARERGVPPSLAEALRQGLAHHGLVRLRRR